VITGSFSGEQEIQRTIYFTNKIVKQLVVLFGGMGKQSAGYVQEPVKREEQT
jgi:hypothetical protein